MTRDASLWHRLIGALLYASIADINVSAPREYVSPDLNSTYR
jgi:hypothetical protein